MEFPGPVKIEEDRKVIIDLDDGISPEDIVVDWHLEMRRFFDSNTAVVGENKLVNVMKKYIKSITERAIHFEDIETLKVMVEKHTEHIYWLYRDLDLCFSDTYLNYMEHIMTFYLNLKFRTLLALKRKMKVTQKIVLGMTEKIVKRISCYLLSSEYHIFHVLIRQATTSLDDVVKDVLNILHSNICKQLFKNLYMHFLVLTPIRDTSDEAFCRAYILFENWKAFEDYRQNEKIEELMKNMFGRSSKCIRDNKFLTDLLQPQTSVISEVMRVVGCNPSITKAYFDYIKSRQKPELEILEDIEKLALEDRGWQEDDEDDDEEYTKLYDKMVGDTYKNKFFIETQNNVDVKEENKSKDPIVEDEDEVIYCGSDSDSDIEIVSIKPSSSYVKAINVPQKLYIQSLKNSSTSKLPKTSFPDSISIVIDSSESKLSSTLEKNLRPNPLSQLFSHAKRIDIEATATSEAYDVNKFPQQKQPVESSCDSSRKKSAISDSNSSQSVAIAHSKSSSTGQATCTASQEVPSSLTKPLEVTNVQCRSSTATCVTDKSSKISKNGYLSENTAISNHSGMEITNYIESTLRNNSPKESLKVIESYCQPLVRRSEATSVSNCSHIESSKDNKDTLYSKTDQTVTGNHSPKQESRLFDVTCKTQTQKNENSVSTIPQTETSKVEEVSPTSSPVQTQTESSTVTEISSESQVGRSEISVGECFQLTEDTSSTSTNDIESQIESSESIEESLVSHLKESENNICDSHVETGEDSSYSKSECFKLTENTSSTSASGIESQIESSKCIEDTSVSHLQESENTICDSHVEPGEDSSYSKSERCSQINEDLCDKKTVTSLSKDPSQNSPETKMDEARNEIDVEPNKDNGAPSESCYVPSEVKDSSHRTTNIEDIAHCEIYNHTQLHLSSDSSNSLNNVGADTFQENISAETIGKRLEEVTKKINIQSDEQIEKIDLQLDKQINYPLKVSTVCEINNTIEQKGPDAQTDEVDETTKSLNNGFISSNKTPCVNSNKLKDTYGESARFNDGSRMFKELENNDQASRKLTKRRNSESSVYECRGLNRCGLNNEEDIVRENSGFKMTGNVKHLIPESTRPSNQRINGQSGHSMFLDTGQCVPPPQPLDTGQTKVIGELSPLTTHLGEEHAADQSNSKTGQHKCSDKRTKSQSGNDELFGYPTPPGSEEDVDDTQPDPVYSNIFPTQTCPEDTDDCYRGGFRLNSDSELHVTVDEIAPTGLVVSSQSCLTANEASVAIVVPEIVYSEQTMSESDFLTEEIDPRDPLVSTEEAELLERLSDEEKVEGDDGGNENLAKSFAQIVKDVVGNHDYEEDSKRMKSVNISDVNRKVTFSLMPNKKELPLEQLDSFDEMAQFLENCKDQYDSSDSPSHPRIKRKRCVEGGPLTKKKSPLKRLRIDPKMESRIIPANTFDEFEAELWNRQSPIGNFAYEYDSSSSDTDDITNVETIRSDGKTNKNEKPTASVKPSPMPPSKHIRQNGSTINLPLSGSTSNPKQPPLRGILKRVEHNHSYHPLHPVDDDPGSSFVYLNVQPDPILQRGTVGSRIKVSRKSLTACKVPKDYTRLFGRYSRVSLDHVWKNTNLEWEKISDVSKRLLWEMMPQRLYRIDYDKTTPHSLNYQIFFIEQPLTDDSSTVVNTRNTNLEIGSGSGTLSLSNEIICTETTEMDFAPPIQLHAPPIQPSVPPIQLHIPPNQLHVPPISPCLSPASNASSEFSDPTNLIPYQDIERALQVVDPDEHACCDETAKSRSDQRLNSRRCDPANVLDNVLVDNISVEAIKLLSNNADFHKIFCDFEGEILIENVPVIDAKNILNVDGTFIKPLPKVDVRLSDKLSDDLLLNLNSDEELLKEICHELETNSLVGSASSSDKSVSMAPNGYFHSSEDVTQDASRVSGPVEEKLAHLAETLNCKVPLNNTSLSKSTTEIEVKPINACSENSSISLTESNPHSNVEIPSISPGYSEIRERKSNELISVDYQLCKETNDQECTDNFKMSVANVTSPAFTEEPLLANSHSTKSKSNYFQNAQLNTQSFQNPPIYPFAQTSNQTFQNSRIGQPLICAPLNDPFFQKPSLIVNVPMPADSLRALSRKKSVAQANLKTAQNALENIHPVHLSVASISDASLYNSLSSLQDSSGALEPLQMDIVPAQQSQCELSSGANIHIRKAFIFSSDSKPKATRRGRPNKHSKKLKENTQSDAKCVKQPTAPNRYQDRVPPIYHSEMEPVRKNVVHCRGPGLGKSQKKKTERNTDENKVKDDASATSSKTSRARVNASAKPKLLPMPVPQTFNFETDTLKQEVYNIRLESAKVDNCENEAEFETHLPLKKRKLSIPVPITPSVPISTTKPSKSPTANLSSPDNGETNEISYPATPMLSIAEVYIPMASRPFKTPAEKKQLPVDPPPPVPIRYDPPNETTPFTCSMNTFTSTVYHLNECPYNVKLDCSSYCPSPPIMFPNESFSRTN